MVGTPAAAHLLYASCELLNTNVLILCIEDYGRVSVYLWLADKAAIIRVLYTGQLQCEIAVLDTDWITSPGPYITQEKCITVPLLQSIDGRST